MPNLKQFRTDWLRPLLFYGNNRISLFGGACTTSSALILIGFWIVDAFGHGGSKNPYLGIIVDLALPALFVLGLVLIPVGIVFRQRHLRAVGQVPSSYPEITFQSPPFLHGVYFVAVATFVNFVIAGTASYRGVAYMDTPSFCGQTCHVMTPEWAAYPASSHSGVTCTECHVAAGFPGYVHAKVSGTRQLLMVVLNNYPRPIMAEERLPPARTTCLNCHDPNAYIGERLLVKTSFADDEKNSVTHTLILIHVGGRDQVGHLSGIHGAHLDGIQYIATDAGHQSIPWVGKVNKDGSVTEFVSGDIKGAVIGQKRVMDCIDCHNRAAHSFDTPEDSLNKSMAAGSPSVSLPFAHKEGLALIKASYSSQVDAVSQITSQFEDFYRTQYPQTWSRQRAQIDQAAHTLVTIYGRNVFPSMRVTWGTHPNNIGHNAYPGCFRCHDGNHNAKNGNSISTDCSVCHNLLAVDESSPRQLTDLGIQ